MQLTRSRLHVLFAWLLLLGSGSAGRGVVFDGVREVEASDGGSFDDLVEVRLHGEGAAFQAETRWLYGRVFELGDGLRQLVVRPVVVELVPQRDNPRADRVTWAPAEPLLPGDYRSVDEGGFPGRYGRFRIAVRELGVQLLDEAEHSLQQGRRLQAQALLRAALEHEVNEDEAPASLEVTLDAVRAQRTLGDIRTIATAIESFAIDNDRYPTVGPTLDSLVELVSPTYIRELPLRDAWDRPLGYRSDGDAYIVVSRGVDGRGDRESYHFGEAGPVSSDDIVFESGSLRCPCPLGAKSDALHQAADRVDALLQGEAGRRSYTLGRLKQLVDELDAMRQAQPLPRVVEPTPIQAALGWPVVDVHGRSLLYRSDGHRYELIVPDAQGSIEKPTRWPAYQDGRSVSVSCECTRERDRRSCRLHP